MLFCGVIRASRNSTSKEQGHLPTRSAIRIVQARVQTAEREARAEVEAHGRSIDVLRLQLQTARSCVSGEGIQRVQQPSPYAATAIVGSHIQVPDHRPSIPSRILSCREADQPPLILGDNCAATAAG